jgi:hypothetical protein
MAQLAPEALTAGVDGGAANASVEPQEIRRNPT